MSNCIFGWPDWTQPTPLYTPTTAGGTWTAALPLANAFDRRLSRLARSADASSDATTLLFDLGTTRRIGVISILVPNMTVSSVPTVRFLVYSDAAYTVNVYNSGFLQAIPTGITIEHMTGADGSRVNIWQTHVLSTAQTQRYVAINIVDTANTDGYLNVARVVIADAFQPAVTMNDGDHFGEESESARNLTDGGAAVYTAKRQRRTHQFGINNLTSAESLATLRRMKRQLGTSQQFMWIPDPADTTYAYERNYLATLRSLSPLESFATRYNSTFEVVEEL